jgi:guanylate kinase
MGKIFYITGPSSTGKDTIFKRILNKKELKLQNIVMYTTRPIRENEEDGVEYYFVDEKELERFEKEGKVIEKRTYDTFHGLWTYFTIVNKEIGMEKQDYLMIGTIESFVKTKEYLGEDKVLPILITVDDGVRLQRALNREQAEENPKFQEMCRRYLADAEDFSKEKIEMAGIESAFINDDLEDCIFKIMEYIKEIKQNKNKE